jgi:hypothetical protein
VTIRLHQALLVVSTVFGSWLAMQDEHECGHILSARATGGRVVGVVLHPLTISRTSLAENPHPLIVVWGGPVFGAAAPLALWLIFAWTRLPGVFVLRFFAGFCLVANGSYLGAGSFMRTGDAADMLLHGSSVWQLLLFGAATIPLGFWLMNGLGPQFGLGPAKGAVRRDVAYSTLAVFLALIAIGLCFPP